MTIKSFATKVGAAIAAISLAAVLSGCGSAATATATVDPLIGVWSVTAAGAPYAPHLFTFATGNTMLSTNPTGVQESTTAPHDGTNDSVGMGIWKATGTNTYVGTFQELNAYADDHKRASTLTVTWSITLNGNNTLSGKASATEDGQTHPATLTGTRIALPTT